MTSNNIFKTGTAVRTLVLCSLSILSVLAVSCNKSGGGNNNQDTSGGGDSGGGGGGTPNMLSARASDPTTCESTSANLCAVVDTNLNLSSSTVVNFTPSAGSVSHVTLSLALPPEAHADEWAVSCPTTIDADTPCTITYSPKTEAPDVQTVSLNYTYTNNLGATASSAAPVLLTYKTVAFSSSPVDLSLPAGAELSSFGKMDFSNSAPLFSLTIDNTFYSGTSRLSDEVGDISEYFASTNGIVMLRPYPISTPSSLIAYNKDNGVFKKLSELIPDGESCDILGRHNCDIYYSFGKSAQDAGTIYAANYQTGNIYAINSDLAPTTAPIAKLTYTTTLTTDATLPILYALTDEPVSLCAFSTSSSITLPPQTCTPAILESDPRFQNQIAYNGTIYVHSVANNFVHITAYSLDTTGTPKIEPKPNFEVIVTGTGFNNLLYDAQSNILYAVINSSKGGNSPFIVYAINGSTGAILWNSQSFDAVSAPFLTKSGRLAMVAAPTGDTNNKGIYIFNKNDGSSPFAKGYYPLDSSVNLNAVNLDSATGKLVIPMTKADGTSKTISMNLEW